MTKVEDLRCSLKVCGSHLKGIMTSTSLSFLELNCPTDVIQGHQDPINDAHGFEASDWSDLDLN